PPSTMLKRCVRTWRGRVTGGRWRWNPANCWRRSTRPSLSLTIPSVPVTKSPFSHRSPEANMSETCIRVQTAPFNVGAEYRWLAERDVHGAVVTFTGKVRNHNLGDSVKALTLEHYPGMTEKALTEIVAGAR